MTDSEAMKRAQRIVASMITNILGDLDVREELRQEDFDPKDIDRIMAQIDRLHTALCNGRVIVKGP